jgi:hypothetical protein
MQVVKVIGGSICAYVAGYNVNRGVFRGPEYTQDISKAHKFHPNGASAVKSMLIGKWEDVLIEKARRK